MAATYKAAQRSKILTANITLLMQEIQTIIILAKVVQQSYL